MSAIIDGINRVAEAWWFFVLHAGWQSAVVGCLLLAVVALGKRWPSTVRYWLLVIALLKFAMPPLLSAPIGLFSHVNVEDQNAPSHSAGSNTLLLRSPADATPLETYASPQLASYEPESSHMPSDQANGSMPKQPGTAVKAAGVEGNEAVRPRKAAEKLVAPTTDTQSSIAATPALSVKGLLMGLHVAGTVIILAWVAVQFAAVRRVVSKCSPVVSGPVMDALQRVTGRLSLRRPARVLLSREATAPLAMGVFRPKIVLPVSTEELSPREIDAVLVHELTHLRRRDTWLAWMEVVLCAVWWFHPVIWLVHRSLRRVCEDCCDDVILVSGIATSTEYCDTLMRVARRSTERPVDMLACPMTSRLHPLGNRFLRIMDSSVRRPLKMSVAATMVVAVTAGLVLPGLSRSSEDQPADESNVAAVDADVADGRIGALQSAPATVAEAKGSGQNRKATPPAGQPSQARPAATTRAEKDRFDGQQYLVEKHTVHISGRATNQDGKPVEGATVYVVQNNRYGLPDPVLGTAQTDIDGRYDLPNVSMPVLEFAPQPVPQPIEGQFQIVATAAAYGYTWRKSMSYRPSPRPAAETASTDAADTFYAKEPIPVDLHFQPEVKVHGRITDDFDEPIAGAEVQLGVVRDIRRSDSRNNEMWQCSYLERGPFAAEGSCNIVRFLPKQFLVARTDAEGRYELTGIPRDASLIAQIEYKQEYPTRSFTIQTARGQTDRHTKSIGHGGEFNDVLIAPREIRVLVNENKSKTPVANVTVTARGGEIQRAGAQAKTGSDGVAVLRLPTGDYTLIAEPSSDAPLLRGTSELSVNKQPRTQEASIALDAAARVLVQTVEDENGKPVDGAVIYCEVDGTTDLSRLQSQTVYVDNPVTDAEGKLHAVVVPGRYRFFANRNVRSKARRASSEWFDLKAGEGTSVAITLPPEPTDEKPQPTEPVAMSEAQQKFEALRETWHRQWQLCSRGRYRVRLNNFLRDNVPRDRLIALVKSCEGTTADECQATLATVFPPLAEQLGRQEIVFDRDRMRGDSLYGAKASDVSAKPDYTYVFNGQETVTYQRDNAQVDIYGIDNSNIGYTQLSDLISIVGVHSTKPRIILSGEQWHGSVVAEGNLLKFVTGEEGKLRSEYDVDAKTGFIHRLRIDVPDNQFSRETWQFGPKFLPNGAVVPTVHFECEYGSGKLHRARFVSIDEVDLMDRVPPETFLVAAEAGTNVLDYRGIPREQFGTNERARSHVLREPVSDVVARANEFAPRKPPVLKTADRAPALDVATWVGGDAEKSAPQLDGKIVLVNFSAKWCGPCRTEWTKIEEASRHFEKNGVVTVGIYDAGDSEADIKDVIAKNKLTYHIAIDTSGPRNQGFGQTAAAYGVEYVPQSAVIGRDGKIAYLGDLNRALETVERLVGTAQQEK
jgi:beta-lactamase regulating signal transducer with metallopeptidase domain/peroxiredoxin/protocatechuate 3,4-dioxygenase beta subunit